MAVVKWILIVLAVLAVAALLAGQLGLLKGKPPADLGVRDGKLKRPSSTNNSVSSQAGLWPDHPQRERARIDPLPLRGDGAATLAAIAGVVKAMPGARVVEQRPDYLYAQFTTRLMKYVDDVEFWVDPASPYYKDVFGSGKEFVFYCASAWRSALATAVVQEMGLEPVCHIDGGFNGWKAGGGETAARPKHEH